jgi:hypothetical protein
MVMPAVKLVLALLVLSLFGCSGEIKRTEPDRVLPFTVKLTEVKLPDLQGEGAEREQISTPAAFTDKEQLTERLAKALEQAGVFARVVTDKDASISPDLELAIEIIGNDFGPGKTLVTGAIFSTLAWLFAGHLSWFIDNKYYPNSKVVMNISIRYPEAMMESAREKKPTDLWPDDLPLDGMVLSFFDRADTKHWFFNILVPPWVGEGNPAVAGRKLGEESVRFFATNEPGRILTSFPGQYFQRMESFLVHDRENDRAVIITQSPITSIRISDEGETIREFRGDTELEEVKVNDDAKKKEIEHLLAGRLVGIGKGSQTSSIRYYVVPVEEYRPEFLQIEVSLESGLESHPRGRWTIHRPAKVEIPADLATSRS